MKLRNKIKLSFIVLTLIPILAIGSVICWIGNSQIKSIEKKYNVSDVGIESLSNPTRIYSKFTQNIYNKLVNKVQNDVDDITDIEYLTKLNNELREKYSFIVVKKGDQVIYSGADSDENEIVEKLPEYKSGNAVTMDSKYFGSSYIYGDYKYLVKQLTFVYKDNDDGSVYIISDIEGVIPQFKKMAIQFIITAVFVVVLVAMILTVWIYRSVMRPLKKLTVATNKIAEGDLDFTIEPEINDEFGELCDDFEKMRVRLKNSAEDKVKDEAESKELISNISHDLKTPLTAIKGYVEGIMDGVADTPEKMEKYIKTIYNKANDMDRLIGELTVYSKIDTNRIPYKFEKVNVDKYFEDCVEEITLELEAKGIQLNYFNYADKDAVIIADVEQLKRVINNIISNSVKYIGNKQGAVNIRINDENDFIHVQIEDNGKGIDKRDLPYIFDRFYRTDSSRNSNQGGSGIGLAIARKIIEVHGGKIWATSMIDTGTVMHFIIRKYVQSEPNDVIDV